jgi:glucokinase
MTVLACDFGGRRIKLGLVRDGQVVVSSVVDARSEGPLAERLPVVAGQLRQLCQADGIDPQACRGVGISYPSIVDPVSARILDQYGKYADASSLDLRAWAADAFHLPLAMENDARMALIGEWRYGVGRGCDNLAMIMFGTGLGVAAVVEGRLLRGRHGQAAILGGHLAVRYDGRACVCGNVGCAEAEASTSVLSAIVRETPGFGESPLAQEVQLSYQTVFRLAAQGDPCAMKIKDRSLRVWGATAVNLIHAFDPEMIVLGGGIMGSADVVLPAISGWVREHAHTPWGQVEVVASQLGDHAALVAAEWLIDECRGKDS